MVIWLMGRSSYAVSFHLSPPSPVMFAGWFLPRATHLDELHQSAHWSHMQESHRDQSLKTGTIHCSKLAAPNPTLVHLPEVDDCLVSLPLLTPNVARAVPRIRTHATAFGWVSRPALNPQEHSGSRVDKIRPGAFHTEYDISSSRRKKYWKQYINKNIYETTEIFSSCTRQA